MKIQKNIIIGYYFKYVVFLLVFKNIHYLLGIGINNLLTFPLVFIPIAYLVVKFLFYHDLEKRNLNRKDYLLYIVIGYSVLNLLFLMPILYDLSIVLMLLIIKDQKTNESLIIEKNIREYYENKENNSKK